MRSAGPRSASFARCAVVAGAFVRSGTRVGWSRACVVAGEEYRTTLRELRSLRCGRWCLRTVWYKSSAGRCACLRRQLCRQPLDPYQWAGYAANHYRPSPEPSAETVTPTVAEPVQQPMPPTNCPKLRLMRELLAEEAAAKVQNDRAQRQAAAIQKWRSAPAESRACGIFPAWGRSAQRRPEHGRDRGSTLRQEAGYARHPAERRREIKEHHADASGIVSPTGCLTIR